MVESGSRILIPGEKGMGEVLLLALHQLPDTSWFFLVISDEGQQSTVILSDKEIDGVVIVSSPDSEVGNYYKEEKDLISTDGDKKRHSLGKKSRLLAVCAMALGMIVVGAVFFTGRDDARLFVDEFSNAGELNGRPVGEDNSGLQWSSFGNGWMIADGQLSYNGLDEAAALINLNSEPRSFEVKWIEATKGSGLLFNYVDDKNYWMLVAVPDYATWNLNQVVDGKFSFVENTGLSRISGAVTSISFSGNEFTIRVGAEVKIVKTFQSVPEPNSVGILKPISGEESKFSNVLNVESVSLKID
jgi:hypothetical protein